MTDEKPARELYSTPWWGLFLLVRMQCIRAWKAEGADHADIFHSLSVDPGQISLLMASDHELVRRDGAAVPASNIDQLIQALDPKTRAEVLGPYITMASTAELCANMALDVIRERERATEAESRATVAEGKVVELENEIASRKRAARERVTAEECEPDETIARLAEMEKR